MDEEKDGAANYSHLWNDLPFEERHRLMPYQIQCHITHLKGARRVLVEGHQKTLRNLDQWIKNIERILATSRTVQQQARKREGDGT